MSDTDERAGRQGSSCNACSLAAAKWLIFAAGSAGCFDRIAWARMSISPASWDRPSRRSNFAQLSPGSWQPGDDRAAPPLSRSLEPADILTRPRRFPSRLIQLSQLPAAVADIRVRSLPSRSRIARARLNFAWLSSYRPRLAVDSRQLDERSGYVAAFDVPVARSSIARACFSNRSASARFPRPSWDSDNVTMAAADFDAVVALHFLPDRHGPFRERLRLGIPLQLVPNDRQCSTEYS